MAVEDDQNPLPPPSPSLTNPPRPVRLNLLDILPYRASHLSEIAKKQVARQWLIYVALSILATAITIAISFVVAYKLVVTDVSYKVPVRGGANGVIRLDVNMLSIDPIAGSMSMDWYPRSTNCVSGVTMSVYDIYFDPNLSDDSGGGKSDTVPSNAPSSDPTFRFNTSIFCDTQISDSSSTFRTTSKLITDNNARGSLQAYPFDLYRTQISLYIIDVATNRSVPAEIVRTWGVAVNYEVSLNNVWFNTDQGMYYVLDVSRSRAVKLFVIIILIANWIVTVVFLWITAACIFWNEEVVKELFLVPVSTLFAFTAVRSSMPGSPDGFGAVVDFAGILPNLVLMTFCSFILLILVLYGRIADTHKEMERAKREKQAKESDDGDDGGGDGKTVDAADQMRPASIRSEDAPQAILRSRVASIVSAR